jgi:glycine dehydrogenase subunit 1
MFIPHTDSEREEMLRAIGVKGIQDLFSDVPEKFRFPRLNIPEALTELEVSVMLQSFAAANETTRDLICFLGAGAYNHYVPAAVDAIIRRGEFLTAYTPYQPEVSQGTLQAVFEFQTLVTALTGMEVSNASHYDGATATAEAGILTYHHFRGKRSKFVLAPSLHPEYRAVFHTYLESYSGLSFVGEELDPYTKPNELANLVDANTALVIVQYPDFLGRVFDLSELAEATHNAGSLLCIAINPTALAIFKTPGEYGADIVVGEGQPLGIPLSFGGPYLGIFATRKEFVRKLAGRLVGETVDKAGRRGYVLTLTAREQHIRREKATSNICTNQGLIALAATVYMSLLGKQGLRQVAKLCFHKAHYAAAQINKIPGFNVCSDAPFFHEFVVCCPRPVEEINAHLLEHGILGGLDLGQYYPSLKDHMLIAVTEMNSSDEIDGFVDVLQEVAHV